MQTQSVDYICLTFKNTTIMKTLGYIGAFLGGAIAGAALGLLLAPEKGSDLREKIAEALRKRGIRLNRQEMANLVDEIAEEIKSSQDTDE